MNACRIIVKGRVQGVFFRAETQRKADTLGITGWVRNCENGSVEVFAEGAKEKLEELRKWCKKGPPSARVEEVTVTASRPEALPDFQIRESSP